MLDETRLEAGKLENHGIQAVLHISNLIRKQQLNVDFKFYAIDYNVNVPVLIFSDGKSMFPVSTFGMVEFKHFCNAALRWDDWFKMNHFYLHRAIVTSH